MQDGGRGWAWVRAWKRGITQGVGSKKVRFDGERIWSNVTEWQ